MVKKEDKIAYEIEIERSEKMEQEIDHSKLQPPVQLVVYY